MGASAPGARGWDFAAFGLGGVLLPVNSMHVIIALSHITSGSVILPVQCSFNQHVPLTALQVKLNLPNEPYSTE